MTITYIGENPEVLQQKALLEQQWTTYAPKQVHDPKRNIDQECAALQAEPKNEGLPVKKAKLLIRNTANDVDEALL